jgi:membrane protease YdiL (CAAX protease family)
LKIARKPLLIEICIVFALSLGASAVYSVVSLISKLLAPAGLAGQVTKINTPMARAEWLDLTYQLLAVAFGLAPVALALYLLWQTNQNPFKLLGLSLKKPSFWIPRGLLLAAGIGVPGLALYIGARILGLSSKIVPAELPDYWWTVPILLLAAVKAALVEEVLVVGYLFNRLEKLGLGQNAIITISAAIRGSYHLYQGFAGFIGNFAMGLVFGWLYKKWGRVMPLVFAHFLLDVVSFVGYALVGNSLPLP